MQRLLYNNHTRKTYFEHDCCYYKKDCKILEHLGVNKWFGEKATLKTSYTVSILQSPMQGFCCQLVQAQSFSWEGSMSCRHRYYVPLSILKVLECSYNNYIATRL